MKKLPALLLLTLALSFAHIANAQTQQENEISLLPQQQSQGTITLPKYICELTNLNDYSVFATNGWDASWYVGFNLCWIEEFSLPQNQGIEKAFIGVKLGRAKTYTPDGKPRWKKEIVPGSIYVALSSSPAWRATDSYFLCTTEEIPLEGDKEYATDGTGEARWFWAQVPMNKINFEGKNFVAIYSPSENLSKPENCPIIAGGFGTGDIKSWINNDINGYAPMDIETSLKTPIASFRPAIAIKLVPQNTKQEIGVEIAEILPGATNTSNKTLAVKVSGQSIEKLWIEYTTDKAEAQETGNANWQKTGTAIYGVPYMLTLKPSALPSGDVFISVAAMDEWGNIGYSEAINVEVRK